MTKPGETAFPVSTDTASFGLKIREYFACQIMAGFIANNVSKNLPTIASLSVNAADELVEALNRPV